MAGASDEIIVRILADTTGLVGPLQEASGAVAEAQATMANAAQSAAAEMASASDAAATATIGSLERIRTATSAQVMQWRAAVAEYQAAVAAPLQGVVGTVAAPELQVASAATYQADVSARSYADILGQLEAQEVALDSALASGTMTTEAYAAAMADLDVQTNAVGVAMDNATAQESALMAAQMAQTSAWVEQDGAIAANTAELAANTAAKGENDAAGGGGSGMHGFGVFRAITWLASGLATPPGALLGGLAITLGSVGVAAVHMESEFSGMQNALEASGNAAHTTGSQMASMGSAISAQIGTTGDADAVLTQLAGSGRIAGDQLEGLGRAAEVMSEMTGQSAQQAAQAISAMAEKPQSAIEGLNSKFNFLSATEQEQVTGLLATGHAAEAAAAAYADLTKKAEQYAAAAQESKNPVVRAYDATVNFAEAAGAHLDAALGGGPLAAQLAQAQHDAALGTPGAKAHVAALESEIAAATSRRHTQAANTAFAAIAGGMVDPASMGEIPLANQLIANHIAQFDLQGPAAAAYKHTELTKELRGMTPGTNPYTHVWQQLHGAAGAGDHAAAAHAHLLESAGYNAPLMTSWVTPRITDMLLKTQQDQVKQADQASSIMASSQASHQAAGLHMQESHVQAMASIGLMGHGAALAQEASVANQLYAIKQAEYAKELALAKDKPVEQARINAELVRAQDAHASAMQSINDKATAQQVKTAEAVVAPITQTFSQITAGYVEGTLTRQQAELRLGDALVAETINTGVQMLMHHIAIEEAKTLATAAGTAQRLALHIWAEVEAAAVHAAHAIAWIVTEAAKAAASAFTAMAGIPIIGPVLAVGAAIAASAEVLSFVGSVSSAEGGWERVPMGGAMTQLHPDEMVLPKHVADPVREMAEGGGAGNQYHYHIHANDAAGFEGMLRRNPGALVRALGHAHATGHTA